MNNNTRQPVWQRPKQAVRTAGVSASTIYRWMGDGTIRTMKVGEDVRYVDVSRWINPKPEQANA